MMNNKLSLRVISRNLYILVFTILTTVNFMRDVNQALYKPEYIAETLNINSVEYSLLSLKIDVIHGSLHKLYTIYNYPLIPIIIGIIYNIYFLVKIYRNKDNS
ncbi:hypothetical protein CDLVIII_3876 [Clostridium sp. DL-VIII]|nr:hypothetical protein CDLVIII_3876 [Clostridium sp. DL-VIII]OOM70889.1 hypothetical protein CLOBL_50080 [Clostridium sp. BL-8]